MREYPSSPGAPTLVFAHGAGAGHDHPWVKRVAAGLSERGVRVITFDFPYRAEGRKVPDKAPVLEVAFRRVWSEVVENDRTSSDSPGAYFAGGKSMGGRMASHVAAGEPGFTPPANGLVFFGYPLHAPGKPDQRRDKHLPEIAIPMLFLHGTRDPFGSPDEMRTLVDDGPIAKGLATLEIIDGGDHSLAAPKGKDPGKQSLDRAMDSAAAWMLALSPSRG